MKFLAFLFWPMIATYTYTVTMSNPEQALYIVTNAIAAAAWITLGILIHMSRIRHSPPMVRTWVYPLALSMKVFCVISAVRYTMNNVVIYLPVTQFIQAGIYIVNVLALAIAVGYASVYYKKIPGFLHRLGRHQALSRRFSVIADVAVDAFLETDAAGTIWYANRAAAEIFSVHDSNGNPDPKGLLGHNIVDDFMAGQIQRDFVLMRERYKTEGTADIVGKREPTKLELKRTCGKSYWAELTVTQYQVEAEERFCLVIRDISYRVALEENQKG